MSQLTTFLPYYETTIFLLQAGQLGTEDKGSKTFTAKIRWLCKPRSIFKAMRAGR